MSNRSPKRLPKQTIDSTIDIYQTNLVDQVLYSDKYVERPPTVTKTGFPIAGAAKAKSHRSFRDKASHSVTSTVNLPPISSSSASAPPTETSTGSFSQYTASSRAYIQPKSQGWSAAPTVSLNSSEPPSDKRRTRTKVAHQKLGYTASLYSALAPSSPSSDVRTLTYNDPPNTSNSSLTPTSSTSSPSTSSFCSSSTSSCSGSSIASPLALASPLKNIGAGTRAWRNHSDLEFRQWTSGEHIALVKELSSSVSTLVDQWRKKQGNYGLGGQEDGPWGNAGDNVRKALERVRSVHDKDADEVNPESNDPTQLHRRAPWARDGVVVKGLLQALVAGAHEQFMWASVLRRVTQPTRVRNGKDGKGGHGKEGKEGLNEYALCPSLPLRTLLTTVATQVEDYVSAVQYVVGELLYRTETLLSVSNIQAKHQVLRNTLQQDLCVSLAGELEREIATSEAWERTMAKEKEKYVIAEAAIRNDRQRVLATQPSGARVAAVETALAAGTGIASAVEARATVLGTAASTSTTTASTDTTTIANTTANVNPAIMPAPVATINTDNDLDANREKARLAATLVQTLDLPSISLPMVPTEQWVWENPENTHNISGNASSLCTVGVSDSGDSGANNEGRGHLTIEIRGNCSSEYLPGNLIPIEREKAVQRLVLSEAAHSRHADLGHVYGAYVQELTHVLTGIDEEVEGEEAQEVQEEEETEKGGNTNKIESEEGEGDGMYSSKQDRRGSHQDIGTGTAKDENIGKETSKGYKTLVRELQRVHQEYLAGKHDLPIPSETETAQQLETLTKKYLSPPPTPGSAVVVGDVALFELEADLQRRRDAKIRHSESTRRALVSGQSSRPGTSTSMGTGVGMGSRPATSAGAGLGTGVDMSATATERLQWHGTTNNTITPTSTATTSISTSISTATIANINTNTTDLDTTSIEMLSTPKLSGQPPVDMTLSQLLASVDAQARQAAATSSSTSTLSRPATSTSTSTCTSLTSTLLPRPPTTSTASPSRPQTSSLGRAGSLASSRAHTPALSSTGFSRTHTDNTHNTLSRPPSTSSASSASAPQSSSAHHTSTLGDTSPLSDTATLSSRLTALYDPSALPPTTGRALLAALEEQNTAATQLMAMPSLLVSPLVTGQAQVAVIKGASHYYRIHMGEDDACAVVTVQQLAPLAGVTNYLDVYYHYDCPPTMSTFSGVFSTHDHDNFSYIEYKPDSGLQHMPSEQMLSMWGSMMPPHVAPLPSSLRGGHGNENGGGSIGGEGPYGVGAAQQHTVREHEGYFSYSSRPDAEATSMCTFRIPGRGAGDIFLRVAANGSHVKRYKVTVRVLPAVPDFSTAIEHIVSDLDQQVKWRENVTEKLQALGWARDIEEVRRKEETLRKQEEAEFERKRRRAARRYRDQLLRIQEEAGNMP